MADDSQLLIPPSFVALFVPPGRVKPSASRDAIFERYEFCEDLSAVLVEQAGNVRHELGIAEEDVLERIHRGLVEPTAPVTEAEAGWVVGRLAEHLGWQQALASLAIVAPPDTGRR
ncbi:MAG: ATPase with chaperone activity [Burkholderiaceae bacterium]